jgi:hypothetical protein
VSACEDPRSSLKLLFRRRTDVMTPPPKVFHCIYLFFVVDAHTSGVGGRGERGGQHVRNNHKLSGRRMPERTSCHGFGPWLWSSMAMALVAACLCGRHAMALVRCTLTGVVTNTS